MKTLTLYAMVLVAGICAFASCSKPMEPEPPVVTNEMTRSALEEQLAYDQLLQQLDSLNASYASSNPTMQYVSGIKAPKFKRILKIILSDAIGAAVGSVFTPAPIVSGVVGGVLASVAAAKCKNTTITIKRSSWGVTLSSYVSSIGGDIYDETGSKHNEITTLVLDRYTTEQLTSMTESQLFYAVMQAYVDCGYTIDENFNSYLMPIPALYNMYDNVDTYPQYLQAVATQRPAASNQCQVIETYCDGMNVIREDQCLEYHINFRNTVEASNIPVEAKQDIRLCTSVGYGSANLWDVVDEAE